MVNRVLSRSGRGPRFAGGGNEIELAEFIGYTAFLLALLIPFGAIYLVLKRLGWDLRGRMVQDTWKIWLTWLISSLIAYIVIFWLEPEVRFSFLAFSLAVWSIVIVINILTIALVITIMLRTEKRQLSVISESEDDESVPEPGVWKTSAAASLFATIAIFLALGFFGATNAIYEKLYPPPPGSLAPYH